MAICFATITSGHLLAQSNDLYIVINEATWCKYCKANGERINQLIDKYALNNKVLVINNDVTNEETLQKLGLFEFMEYRKEAAVVFVFNAKTSKITDRFTIKLDNQKIIANLNKSLKMVAN